MRPYEKIELQELGRQFWASDEGKATLGGEPIDNQLPGFLGRVLQHGSEEEEEQFTGDTAEYREIKAAVLRVRP